MRVPCCMPRFSVSNGAIDQVTYVPSSKRQIEEKGIELGEGIDTNEAIAEHARMIKKIQYTGKMDKEVVTLCDALNSIDPSIRTVESCFGHGKAPLRIWFRCTNLRKLPDLLYWFDGCHSGRYGWTITVRTDCGKSFPTFLIESPNRGDDARRDADFLARLIIQEEIEPKKKNKIRRK